MIKLLAGGLLATLLVACGGGGGSPGATTGTTGNTPTTITPTLTLSLVDASFNTVSNNQVTPGAVVYAQARVTDDKAAVVPNKLVSFTAASGLVAFQPAAAQVLTDSNGIARIQVAPATTTTSGADRITATATGIGAGSVAVTASLDVQTTPANVTLSNLVAASTTLTAFQSTSVSVDVAIGGTPAANTPVQLTFTSNCGTFSPATATTNSQGKAVSTFAAAGCVGGPATLRASATGATAIQSNVTVQAPAATNLLFVSATPATIFTSSAPTGVKQSTVVFRVVDASGNGITQTEQVRVSLSPSTIAAGVTFADTNTTAPKLLSTDATGQVTVIVKSGAVPTPLALNAELVSNPTITAASAGLAVNSGRAVQNFFSLSAEKINIEGWDYDGETTRITIRAADRLGQPVPAGTPVSFISEGGQVNGSCQLAADTNGQTACTVTLSSQAFRPTNGRVTVLAYADGEEAFTDTNGNNRYDTGETFFDMGQPFLDANDNNTFDTGEQRVGDASVAGSGIGTASCPAHAYQVSNVAGTCDGSWGAVRVRQSLVIVFSTSSGTAVFSTATRGGFQVQISDRNGNAMPVGSTVSTALSGGTNCSVVSVLPATVLNSVGPTTHDIILRSGTAAGDTCGGAAVTVTVTTPKGNGTVLGTVSIP